MHCDRAALQPGESVLVMGAGGGVGLAAVELAKEAAGPAGFDVVYDPVGAGYSEPAFRAIAWQGRHLVVGFAVGMIPSIPLNLPLFKGAQIVGVIWGSAAMHDATLRSRTQRELLDMLV
jgi:NADPH2:quinone reductase